jgi:hypothetical protein
MAHWYGGLSIAESLMVAPIIGLFATARYLLRWRRR